MPDSPIGSMLPFQWAEEPSTAKLGDGISRPKPEARTRMYRIRVNEPGARPMLVTLPAETKRHAIRYAENRWPEASVEVAA